MKLDMIFLTHSKSIQGRNMKKEKLKNTEYKITVENAELKFKLVQVVTEEQKKRIVTFLAYNNMTKSLVPKE